MEDLETKNQACAVGPREYVAPPTPRTVMSPHIVSINALRKHRKTKVEVIPVQVSGYMRGMRVAAADECSAVDGTRPKNLSRITRNLSG